MFMSPVPFHAVFICKILLPLPLHWSSHFYCNYCTVLPFPTPWLHTVLPKYLPCWSLVFLSFSCIKYFTLTYLKKIYNCSVQSVFQQGLQLHNIVYSNATQNHNNTKENTVIVLIVATVIKFTVQCLDCCPMIVTTPISIVILSHRKYSFLKWHFLTTVITKNNQNQTMRNLGTLK